MNFLQIKQVLTFIYTLKIYFYFIFSGFSSFLDWASNSESAGASLQKPPTDSGSHQSGLRVDFVRTQGLF